MVINAINEYRQRNGKDPIFYWDPAENDYCQAHSQYMAWHNCFEHAPSCLLKDKAEAIACCDFMSNTWDTIRYLLYTCLDSSQEHRNIVLNYNNLAYGFYIYNGKAYLTIRGW